MRRINSVAHHWGYAYETDEARLKKVARNKALLEAEVANNPNDMRVHFHILYEKGARGRVETLPALLELARKNEKQDFSPCIFVCAIQTYSKQELLDPDSVVELSEEYLKRWAYWKDHVFLVDVYACLGYAYSKKEMPQKAIKAFDEYFRIYGLYNSGNLVSGVGMVPLFCADEKSHTDILREYELLKNPPVPETVESLSRTIDAVPSLISTLDYDQILGTIRNISGHGVYPKAITQSCTPEKFMGSIRQLFWAMTALEAAVLTCSSLDDDDKAILFTNFATVSALFAANAYAPELLNDDDIGVLPPLHRFGFHMAIGQNAKDAGDTLGYISALKKAVQTYPGMKEVVEVLTKKIAV